MAKTRAASARRWPMPGRPFYGWVVVASGFLVMLLGFGVAYSFAAFFPALQAEFQASRGDVALIFSLCGFLYFGLGAVSGPLADRLGPRWVVAAGMALVGAGLLAASRAETLWQVYLTYGLVVGVGVGFAYVPAIGAVQHWFVARRGLASGLAVTGIGVGTLAMPPLADWLIALGGWRGAYLWLGIAVIVIGGAAALLIENSPARRGLAPDGAALDDAMLAKPAAVAGGIAVGAALRTGPFWLLFVAATVTSFGIFIPFVHLAAYAVDHGHSQATGVALISLIGVGSIAGRFLLGGVADRFGRRLSFAGMFVGMAVMLVFWLAATGIVALAAFAVLFGTFYGGFVALAPALTADYFGGRNISAIIGLLYSGVGLGTLLGPTLAGVAFDLTGSYTLPIAAGAALNLVAIAAMLAMQDPARWHAAVSERS